jgi:hypothetical protein
LRADLQFRPLRASAQHLADFSQVSLGIRALFKLLQSLWELIQRSIVCHQILDGQKPRIVTVAVIDEPHQCVEHPTKARGLSDEFLPFVRGILDVFDEEDYIFGELEQCIDAQIDTRRVYSIRVVFGSMLFLPITGEENESLTK